MALQLSARAVSQLLASIFGPSFYDDPRFGRGTSSTGVQMTGGSKPAVRQIHSMLLRVIAFAMRSEEVEPVGCRDRDVEGVRRALGGQAGADRP